MNNNKISFFLLVVFIFSASNAMESLEPQHVVVAFNDFLIKPNMAKAAQKIGISRLVGMWLGSWVGGTDPQKLLPDFFAALTKITPHEQSPHKIYWQNQEAPYLIYEFLISQDSQKVLKKVKDGLAAQQLENLETMLKFADITFNPSDNAEIMEPIPETFQLIQDLKKEGHTIHLLGNCNRDTAIILRKSHSNLFDTINGHTLLSGQIEAPKSPDMYRKFFDLSKVDPKKTVFIETQQDHVNDLKQLDVEQSLLFTEGNIQKTRKSLIQFGLLSHQE